MLEDDSDDRYLTNEVLSDLNFNIHIQFYSTSNELFEGLKKSLPDLILVDYNSTPQNGIDVLRTLKADKEIAAIPVVLLSDSGVSKYKNECYLHGASGFVVKPDSLAETKKKVSVFFNYWTSVSES